MAWIGRFPEIFNVRTEAFKLFLAGLLFRLFFTAAAEATRLLEAVAAPALVAASAFCPKRGRRKRDRPENSPGH